MSNCDKCHRSKTTIRKPLVAICGRQNDTIISTTAAAATHSVELSERSELRGVVSSTVRCTMAAFDADATTQGGSTERKRKFPTQTQNFPTG
ncbi:hypothetical protein LSTR_LSTR007206 [Laodelphax striatellus]|uniref:Uncharacterized protein n=1 Tax=Laodelphax striatellus TaxID=195883 RepID=A0A482XE97_LAOST|nr:hypothetical protein LSTR_LSTR007206 [Laodelphax striatellus]